MKTVKEKTFVKMAGDPRSGQAIHPKLGRPVKATASSAVYAVPPGLVEYVDGLIDGWPDEPDTTPAKKTPGAPQWCAGPSPAAESAGNGEKK